MIRHRSNINRYIRCAKVISCAMILFFILIINITMVILDMGFEVKFTKRSEDAIERMEATTSYFNMEKKFDVIPEYRNHYLRNHIYFIHMDRKRVYSNQGSTSGQFASRAKHPLERRFFQELQDYCRDFLSEDLNEDKSKIECPEIRYRFLPTLFIESEVFCTIPSMGRFERITVKQPLHPMEIVSRSSTDLRNGNETSSRFANINIIIALKGRITSFKIFLRSLVTMMENQKPKAMDLKIGLTVVYFEDDDVKTASKLALSIQGRKDILIHFITINWKTFTRSEGLRNGLKYTNIQSDIVFICDVDLWFNFEFIQRCISTPVLGKQLYFPMTFSLYNRSKKKTNAPSFTDSDGYWRIHGFGMVCGFRGDFIMLRAFAEKYVGWGKEDSHFLQKVAKDSRYKIIRATDPGLFHRYHEKECSSADTKFKQECLNVKYINEASKEALGKWYFQWKELALRQKQRLRAINKTNTTNARGNNE